MLVTKLSKAGVLFLFLFLAVALADGPVPDTRDFIELLHVGTDLTDGDMARLWAGSAVARILPEHGNRELAIAGAIGVKVPLEFFLNTFREVPTLERGREALLVGKFSDPPLKDDLLSLTLTPADADALSQCTPGQCDVKLSATMMGRLRQENTGKTAVDRKTVVTSLFRDRILEYVSTYLNRGDAAMVTYADKLPPVQSSAEFLGLLKEFHWLSDYASPLYDCLESYSGSPCPNIESFVYWTSARFGLKPVFAVTHAMIYKAVRGGQTWTFIALKQIYANHYFESSLGIAVLVEGTTPQASPEAWVGYIHRSRIDALQGWFGPLKRAITESRSREAMEKDLAELKVVVERRYQAPTSK
jgi:hypothetical protein